MQVQTQAFRIAPTRFDMVGQRLSHQCIQSDIEISTGLVQRLVKYAEEVMDDSGFLGAVKGWDVIVGTLDAEQRPSDRCYWVEWKNAKGGRLKVVGITTKSGWPFLDHGIEVERA